MICMKGPVPRRIRWFVRTACIRPSWFLWDVLMGPGFRGRWVLYPCGFGACPGCSKVGISCPGPYQALYIVLGVAWRNETMFAYMERSRHGRTAHRVFHHLMEPVVESAHGFPIPRYAPSSPGRFPWNIVENRTSYVAHGLGRYGPAPTLNLLGCYSKQTTFSCLFTGSHALSGVLVSSTNR